MPNGQPKKPDVGTRSPDDASGLQESQPVYDAGLSETPTPELPDGTKMTVGGRLRFGFRLFPRTEWPKRFGRDDKTVRRYEAGQDVPLSVVTALSEATGIPTEWFAFGTSLGVLTHFELVKRLEVRASGGGALARSEESEEPVAFRADWLRRLGVSPRNARTMFAHGDSMEPTIGDGDLLLVDQSIDHIVDHGIYIVVYQGMVLVKRVQMRRDGTLVLKSDNPRYDEEVVPHSEAHDIHVAGRVRWYGRTI